MTREEALQWLTNEKWQNANNKYKKEWNEAFDMAIEALRREKPKNPVINFVSDADGSRRLSEGWREDALLCPVCHTYFGEVFEEGYCRECGQKLIQKRVKVIEE